MPSPSGSPSKINFKEAVHQVMMMQKVLTQFPVAGPFVSAAKKIFSVNADSVDPDSPKADSAEQSDKIEKKRIETISAFNEFIKNQAVFAKSMAETAKKLGEMKLSPSLFGRKKKKQEKEVVEKLNQYRAWYQKLGDNRFSADLSLDLGAKESDILDKFGSLEGILKSDEMYEYIAYMAKITKHYLEILAFFTDEKNLNILVSGEKRRDRESKKEAFKRNIIRDQLIKPVQYLMRYELTLKEVLKNLEKAEFDDPKLKKLMEECTEVAKLFATAGNAATSSANHTIQLNNKGKFYRVGTLKAVKLDLKKRDDVEVEGETVDDNHSDSSISLDLNFANGLSGAVGDDLFIKDAVKVDDETDSDEDAITPQEIQNQDLLEAVQQCLLNATRKYSKWYQDEKPTLSIFKHGSTGQLNASRFTFGLLADIKNKDNPISFEAAKNELVKYLNGGKGKLNDHSFKTYLLKEIKESLKLSEQFVADVGQLSTETKLERTSTVARITSGTS